MALALRQQKVGEVSVEGPLGTGSGTGNQDHQLQLWTAASAGVGSARLDSGMPPDSTGQSIIRFFIKLLVYIKPVTIVAS